MARQEERRTEEKTAATPRERDRDGSWVPVARLDRSAVGGRARIRLCVRAERPRQE